MINLAENWKGCFFQIAQVSSKYITSAASQRKVSYLILPPEIAGLHAGYIYQTSLSRNNARSISFYFQFKIGVGMYHLKHPIQHSSDLAIGNIIVVAIESACKVSSNCQMPLFLLICRYFKQAAMLLMRILVPSQTNCSEQIFMMIGRVHRVSIIKIHIAATS